MFQQQKIPGFSLVEMLITFFIACILFSFAIPSFQFFLTKSNTDIMRLQLLHAIQMTRSEAIMRAETVTLCPSADQKTCGGSWQGGYVIFNRNGVIHAFLNSNHKSELHWRAFPKNQTQLHYLPSGELNAENGTFWYCLQGAKNPSWAIVLSQSGRVRQIVANDQGEFREPGLFC